VDGKPVFGVYRAELLPDPTATIASWRGEAERAGLPGLYLVRIEAHTLRWEDPRTMGFDAAVEFEPHPAFLGPAVRPSLPGRVFNRAVRPEHALRHHLVRRYETLARNAAAQPEQPYPRYRCVTPGWDNSPRRNRWALLLTGSTPDEYGRWLDAVVDTFSPMSPEENFVFINAWNEWAEGNHLEPDLRWGRRYLEETARALGRLDHKPSASAAAPR
jgi:lipopolysaccharide biosynthesis protein